MMNKELLRQQVKDREGKLEYPENVEIPSNIGAKEQCRITFDQNGATAIGWIHFRISTKSDSFMFYCSYQCSPFWLLLSWLRAIESTAEPVMMLFNEERWQTRLYAIPHDDEKLCYIRIDDDATGETDFLVLVERMEFVAAVRKALCVFIDEDYDEEAWFDEDFCYNVFGEEPYMNLKWIRKFIDSGADIEEFYDYPFEENEL